MCYLPLSVYSRSAALTSWPETTDVVKTTVYVASARQPDLVAAWEVVRDHFGDHDPPSALLGVTVLGYDHELVEIDALAAVRA